MAAGRECGPAFWLAGSFCGWYAHGAFRCGPATRLSCFPGATHRWRTITPSTFQARGVASFFVTNYPSDSVWIFFGAGNVAGEKPVFGDVRRKQRSHGDLVDSWLAGALPQNRPARREVVMRTFREEILPAVADGGTLFLFVGDHGSRPDGEEKESVINLWSLERDPLNRYGWRYDNDQSLSVTDLRRLFLDGLGKGSVVFCMTQCHSGGFHYMAIPHAISPRPAWFTARLNQAENQAEKVEVPEFPRVAGFTATDEFSPAAGCDPAPDPARWAGYERFIPERLFGLDLFKLQTTGVRLGSFAEAHVAATLSDQTIDKPYSTSEQYLERWADVIENMAKEGKLTRAASRALSHYERVMDGASPKRMDDALQARQRVFRRFVEQLALANPDSRELLLYGKRRQLEAVLEPVRDFRNEETPRPRRRRRGNFRLMRQFWTDVVHPAWRRAVEANQVKGIPEAALEFERHLLVQEKDGEDYFFARDQDRLEEEAFWNSGYSDPATLDPDKAEAVVRWSVERRGRVLDWAKTEGTEAVRSAAEKLSERFSARPSLAAEAAAWEKEEAMPLETAVERVLFYRRVLGAWEFLLEVDDQPALASLNALIELEQTALPAGRAGEIRP